MSEVKDSSEQNAVNRLVDLAAPTIPQVTDGVLFPGAARGGVDVFLPEDLVLFPDDSVRATFDGLEHLLSPGQRGIRFESSELGRHLGRAFYVYYVLRRNEVEHLSAAAPLIFRPFSVHDPLLPAPFIAQASAGVLDLTTFQDVATARVPPWPLIAPGQFIRIDLHAVDYDGSPRTLEVRAMEIGEHQINYGVATDIPRLFLERRPSGSRITLTVQVNFGTAEAPHVVTFPEARYTLIHDARPPTPLVPAQIAEAVGDVIDPDAVPEGGATVLIAANSHIAPGVHILFMMEGRAPNGDQVWYEEGRRIQEPVTFPVTFFIPRDRIVRLAGGTAKLVYYVEIPDEGPLTAPERVYDIGLGTSGQRSSSR